MGQACRKVFRIPCSILDAEIVCDFADTILHEFVQGELVTS